MASAARMLGQVAVYAAVAVLIGGFSNTPDYRPFPADQALLKLSFSHGGKRDCRRLSADEIAALPANLRRPFDCPRERPAVYVEIDMDGVPLYQATLPPTGLSRDGPSRVYRRFAVEPGDHVIAARLRDTARDDGFDYRFDGAVSLTVGQNLVIDFRGETGGFFVK